MQLTKKFFIFAFIVLTFCFLGCSKEDSDDKNPQKILENTLVFQRADNSNIEFSSKVYIWSGEWEPGDITDQALHIWVGVDSADTSSFYESSWQLMAVKDDMVIGQEFTFPNLYIWDQPKDVSIFVYDALNHNELSTQMENSTGSITFQIFDCVEGGEIAFTIDAIIASELAEGDSVKIQGTFRAIVGKTPEE